VQESAARDQWLAARQADLLPLRIHTPKTAA
jgi:hypothetical protein